jgi:protein-tyrosine phosphatase
MLIRKFKTFLLRLGAKRALRDARSTTVRALAAHGGPNAKVLVVCHGNIYRSPLVAVRLGELLGPGRVITSAGFHPKGERLSPAEHIDMSARHGMDLSQHRSRVVSDEDFARADLIVLMDQRNWVSLQRAGADESRYVWLGAMGPNPMEIPDPYGLDAAAAEAIVKRLLLCTEELATRLR